MLASLLAIGYSIFMLFNRNTHRKFVIPALLFMAGCSPVVEQLNYDLSDQLDLLLTTGLSDIKDYYIEDANITDLAVNGLRNFNKHMNELNFIQDNNQVYFKVNDEIIAQAALPEDQNNIEELAFVIAQLLEDVKNESTVMALQNDESIIEILFDGMLEPLDKYTRYTGPIQASAERDNREGFGGVGLTLGDHSKGALVTAVNAGDPAEAAGIHEGDVIIAIDNQFIAGKSISDIDQLLRGPENQAVLVSILRTGIDAIQDINVGRNHIVPNTVFYDLKDGYPAIRLSSFNKRTAKRIAEAVSNAIRDTGLMPKGLIIDLRDNPGGLLDQAVDIADLFLDSGVISQIDGRNPVSDQLFVAEEGDISSGAPIIVLINGATASAAEILAAALQDNGRAVIIGSNSFGKGSVQKVLAMPNTGELILTWAHFHSPDKYPLNEFGIIPNICTYGVNSDWILSTNTFKIHLDESLKVFHDSRRTLRDIEPSVSDHRRLCQWQGMDGADVDMATALHLLKNIELYNHALHISAVN